VQSNYLFGSSIDSFTTFSKAFNANFEMLLGGTDYNNEIMAQYQVIGFIFVYSFNFIVFFVLLNILLAILVEAYMKVKEDNEAKDSKSVPTELYSVLRSTYCDWSCARDQIAKSNWMANYYATSSEILEAVGPAAEDPEPIERQVMKVDLQAGHWLNVGRRAIMKALSTHPDTKHLDSETMTRIACTMIFRFGTEEGSSLEHDLTLDFSDEELVAMSKDLICQAPEIITQEIPRSAPAPQVTVQDPEAPTNLGAQPLGMFGGGMTAVPVAQRWCGPPYDNAKADRVVEAI